MDNRIKNLWLEALRSGEYKQTNGTLHRLKHFDSIPERHCCLGVLCDLAVKDGLPVEVKARIEYVEYDDESCTLPSRVIKWAGLTYNDLFIGNKRLSEYNDEGASFDQIADLIEKHL